MKVLSLVAVAFLLAGCASSTTEDALVQEASTAQTQEQQEQTSDDEPSAEDEASEGGEVAEAAEPLAESGEPKEAMEPSSAVASEPEQTSTPSTAPTATPTASPTPTPTTEPEPTETADPSPAGFTMAAISANNTAAKCWVAIDGMAYDLTDWITFPHPGGAAAITSLCGTDGTSQFLRKHGGQANPDRTLDRYLLGAITG